MFVGKEDEDLKKDLLYALAVLVIWVAVWVGVTIFLDVVVFGEEINWLRSIIPAAAGGIVFAIITYVQRRKKKS